MGLGVVVLKRWFTYNWCKILRQRGKVWQWKQRLEFGVQWQVAATSLKFCNVEIFIFTLNDNKNGHQEFFLKTHILTLCLKFLKNTSKWIAFCDKFSGCRPIETKSNKLLHRYCLSILTTDTVKLRYRSFFHRTPIFVEELSMDASADLQSHTM